MSAVVAKHAAAKRKVSKSNRPGKGLTLSHINSGGSSRVPSGTSVAPPRPPAARGVAFEDDLIEARAQLLELRGMLDFMKQTQDDFLKELRAEGMSGGLRRFSPRRQSLVSHFSAQLSAKNRFSGGGKEETMAEKRVLNKLESYGQVPAASVHDDHPKFIGPNTCRAKGNAVLMSLQTLFVFLISVNVLWLAVEVDVPESSSWYDTVTLVSYILTVTFFLEAVLNMMFVPSWWMNRVILIDAVLCVIVFVLETLALVGVLGDGLKWLSVLRCLRIVRFAWKLRRKNAGRPLRVLMTAASGCTWTFAWVALMLVLSFYAPALIARSALNESSSTVVRSIVHDYFPSTPLAIVTFIHCFLGAFNYDAAIIRPLLHESDLWPVGALLLFYGIFMVVCASNFISGLFIEFILKAARKSDDLLDQENLSLRELSMEDLLRLFHRIDQDDEGQFGLEGFISAMDDDPELENALHVLSEKTREELEGDLVQDTSTTDLKIIEHKRQTQCRDRDRELFFHSLDILGHGEVAFSDFVYGVMKSLSPPKSLEQLIFDYQFSKIVRMHGECWRASVDVQDFLTHHKTAVTSMSGKLGQDNIVHAADVSHIKKSFVSLNDKLDIVCADISNDGSQGSKVLTLAHAKKTMEMGGLLQQLVDKMEEAMVCAEKQANQSAHALSTITGDFTAEVQKVARMELDIMQRHGREASQRAAAAAVSGKRSRDKIAALLSSGHH